MKVFCRCTIILIFLLIGFVSTIDARNLKRRYHHRSSSSSSNSSSNNQQHRRRYEKQQQHHQDEQERQLLASGIDHISLHEILQIIPFISNIYHLNIVDDIVGAGQFAVLNAVLGMSVMRGGLVANLNDQGQCGSCWAFSATGAVGGGGTQLSDRTSRVLSYMVHMYNPVRAYQLEGMSPSIRTVGEVCGVITGMNEELLRTTRMIDFAGSGVVHMTGGATALIAAIILGPRRRRRRRRRRRNRNRRHLGGDNRNLHMINNNNRSNRNQNRDLTTYNIHGKKGINNIINIIDDVGNIILDIFEYCDIATEIDYAIQTNCGSGMYLFSEQYSMTTRNICGMPTHYVAGTGRDEYDDPSLTTTTTTTETDTLPLSLEEEALSPAPSPEPSPAPSPLPSSS